MVLTFRLNITNEYIVDVEFETVICAYPVKNEFFISAPYMIFLNLHQKNLDSQCRLKSMWKYNKMCSSYSHNELLWPSFNSIIRRELARFRDI